MEVLSDRTRGEIRNMKRIKQINVIVGLLLAQLIYCANADAHFVFVYSEDGKIKVVFGEDTDPDQAQFLGGLKDMKAFTTIDGESKELTFEKMVEGDDGWFEVSRDSVGDEVSVACPYGIFGRGDKSMLLDYSAKFVQLSSQSKLTPTKGLALDLVPEMTDGKLKITTYFKGMPLSNAEVKLVRVETDSMETTSDETGSLIVSPNARYIVRAKHTLEEAGEIDGKSYSEKKYYCTLVLDIAGDSSSEKAVASQATAHSQPVESSVVIEKVDGEFADFPRGMTSFGAAAIDGRVFVVGGKAGKAHSYAKSYQNRDVFCLDFNSESSQWKSVGENLGLQGLAIVAHDGKFYRIGGLEARNEEGDEHDLHSIADVLKFDPADQSWTQMPSLPEGRSSFDATVHDDKIYVVGGWKMTGEDDPVWAEDVLVFDLEKPESDWQRIPAPFCTRALAVRVHGDKLVAVGGIEDGGGPTAAVHIFDPKTNSWTEGAAIPTEGGMKAFGCSAVTVNENLLVSTYDGNVYRLSDDWSQWEVAYKLENGRFFHQMLPLDDSRFVIVGGSHMEHGSQNEVEVFKISVD